MTARAGTLVRMKFRTLRARSTALSIALMVTSLEARARACAPAPMAGQAVAIAGEEALIVWDEATHTEHFVRRASFRTAARDFGFLVPTPTAPTLAAAPDRIFATLEAQLRPAVRYERPLEVEVSAFCLGMFFLRGSAHDTVRVAAQQQVRVLGSQRVAGYDAVVLEADSASALADWLREKGYEQRPSLLEWLRPYVDAHWKITAFRIAAPDASAGAIAGAGLDTEAVRMSFRTERPFYPYREPSDQRAAGAESYARTLRVYVVSGERVDGALANGAVFPGQIELARPTPGLESMLAPLTIGALPPNPWLTVFVDRSSPRPGTDDVYFSRAAAQSVVVPPPVTVREARKIPIFLDLLVLVGVLVGVVVRARVRRRRARP